MAWPIDELKQEVENITKNFGIRILDIEKIIQKIDPDKICSRSDFDELKAKVESLETDIKELLKLVKENPSKVIDNSSNGIEENDLPSDQKKHEGTNIVDKTEENSIYVDKKSLSVEKETIERKYEPAKVKIDTPTYEKYYLEIPEDDKGRFNNKKKSKQPNSESYYLIKVDVRDEKIAYFTPLTDDETKRIRAIAEFGTIIKPVCKVLNLEGINVSSCSHIIVKKEGTLKLIGDRWEIKNNEKCEIEMY